MMVDLILPGAGAPLVRLLSQRRGLPTRLSLRDGREVTAWNCAWGMEYGRDWEHLTLNMSPRCDEEAAFLSSGDVLAACDPATGRALYALPSN